MGNAVKKISMTLSEILYSEEQFKKLRLEEIESDTWFELEEHGKFLGFVKQNDLKELIFLKEVYFEGVRVRHNSEEDFRELYDLPQFQRRRPQIVVQQILNPDAKNLYLLINGQKDGPYTTNDLMMMMDERKILPTDLVSLDDGNNFIKLFLVEGFDRRHLKSHQELPNPLDQEIVLKNQKEILRGPKKNHMETWAMAGLAFLGNKSHAKKHSLKEDELLEHSLQKTYSLYSFISLLIFGVIFLFSLYQMRNVFPLKMITDNFFSGEDPNSKKDFIGVDNNGQKIEGQKINDDSSRTLKVIESQNTPTELTPIRPAKVRPYGEDRRLKDAERLRQRNISESNNEQEIADTTTQFIEPAEPVVEDTPPPVELDPVRAQISKEILNGENETEEGNSEGEEGAEQNTSNKTEE